MNIDCSLFSIKAESSMRLSTTLTSAISSWLGGSAIGGQFAQAVDLTAYNTLKGTITTGNSYSTTVERFKIHIYIMSTSYNPSTWADDSPTFQEKIYTYNIRNSTIDFEIDVSDLTGNHYIVLAGHGWTVNYTNLVLEELPLNSYTVMFSSNGGSGSMEPQTIEIDTYTTLTLCSFSREGYTFIGWATSSTGSVQYTDGDTVYNLAQVGETITLYAVWRKDPPYLIIQENKSETISLTKELVDILQTPFTLKEETSIIDPVFVINCPIDLLFRANYLTAPSLGRKYFIQDIVSMTNDLVELTCHVDVLSTYADEIKANKGIVHRQENNWNLYLNDGVLQVYQNPIVTTQAFPDGFKENNFVLVTAGTRGLKGVDIGEGGEIDIENDLGAGNNESRTTGGLSWYAQQQVGKPYWYGTFGNIASADLYNYKKIQYPSYYTASDFPSQYGQKVHDCVGIIKGYRWGTYPYTAEPTYVPEQDVDVRGLYNQCIRYRGDIARSPLGDIITDLYEGCCVFYGDMTHVGVYIGNDQVAEAKSHADGVVITDIKQRTGFTLWGVPDWIKITTTYL